MRQTFKIFGLAVLALIVVLRLAALEENWRARRDWERYRAELAKSGEKLDLEAFIPPSIPDSRNFFADSVFRPAVEQGQTSRKPGEPLTDSPALKELKEVRLSKLRPEGDKNPLPTLPVAQTGKAFSTHDWAKSLGCAAADSAHTGEEALKCLAKLQPFESKMNEVRRAAQKPEGRFPLHYELGLGMPFPHVTIVMNLAHLFCLHGALELGARNSEVAAQDVAVIDAMQRALQADPLMISHLVRMMVVTDLAQVIWQGLTAQQWNDSQLQEFQRICDGVHLFRDQQRAVGAERCILNRDFDLFRAAPAPFYASVKLLLSLDDKDQQFGLFRFLPQKALLYRNQIQYSRWLQEFVLGSVDPGAEKVKPGTLADLDSVLKGTRTTPYNFFAKMTLPTFENFTQRTAAVDVLLREATTACALERFRLKNGTFPTALTELVPEFLSALPADPFSPSPFHYRRTENGNYLIYSVGWNQADDGGAIVLKAANKAKRDDDAGDWVWFSSPGP